MYWFTVGISTINSFEDIKMRIANFGSGWKPQKRESEQVLYCRMLAELAILKYHRHIPQWRTRQGIYIRDNGAFSKEVLLRGTIEDFDGSNIYVTVYIVATKSKDCAWEYQKVNLYLSGLHFSSSEAILLEFRKEIEKYL